MSRMICIICYLFLNLCLGVVRLEYLKKKYNLEKFELNLGLPLLDAEIKHFKNKLLRLTPIPQKVNIIHLQH